MSAVILPFNLGRHAERSPQNLEESAHRAILDGLRGRGLTGERIAQAQSRAARAVKAGVSLTDAVFRAKAWAMSATDPTIPPNGPPPKRAA